MSPAWRGARHIAVAAAFGLVLGVVTQLADSVSDSLTRAFAGSTGPWLIAAVLAGRSAPNRVAAGVGGAVLLWAATLVFYAWPQEGSAPGVGTAAFWLAAIVLIGPVLGISGHLGRGSGRLAALATGFVAGWLLGEAIYVLLEQDGGDRWLLIGIDCGAALCLLGLVGEARRLAYATALVATAGPIAFLFVVELLVDTLLR